MERQPIKYLQVITGDNGETVKAKFNWISEVNWNPDNEPCKVDVFGFNKNSWKMLGYLDRFEMEHAIKSGVNFGFKIENNTSLRLLYWP